MMWSLLTSVALAVTSSTAQDVQEAPDALNDVQTENNAVEETPSVSGEEGAEAKKGDGQPYPASVDAHALGPHGSPTSRVQSLVAVAQANDRAAFEEHLSRTFKATLAYLNEHDVEHRGVYTTEAVMTSLADLQIASMAETVLYDRATVRVTLADGRVIRLLLKHHEAGWFVLPPADMRERVEALQRPDNLQELIDREMGDNPELSEPVQNAQTEAMPAAPVESSPAQEESSPAPVEPSEHQEQKTKLGFFDRGSVGHYLWYVPDWLFVGAASTAFALQLDKSIPPFFVLIGPDYDPESPDGQALRDSRLDGTIGLTYVQEKVPTEALIVATLLGTGVAGAIDVIDHQDFHHTHSLVLGGLTSVLLTYAATMALKHSFGRLRPDFRDRYTRAACGGYVEADASIDCSSAPQDGVIVSKEDVYDGMKSFPSGHSSTAFSLATYYSLYLGTEWVFGKHAPAWSMPVATLAIGGLYAGAMYVAASRYGDNRHHLEDIAVGAALGTAIGAGSYLLHFDLDGVARTRGFQVAPMITDQTGGGVALSGTF